MTKYLVNLEEYIKLSYEVDESHTGVVKIVHNFLSEMKLNLEQVLADGSLSGTIDRLMQKIVADHHPVDRQGRRGARQA
jgi:hypothetical protein